MQARASTAGAFAAVIIDGTTDAAIARGVRTLRAGGLLGLPTETVYGLAADACNADAVRRVFELKGRPAGHPLIVHVRGPEQVPEFASEVGPVAQRLMAAFWPGPLSLVLPRRPDAAEQAAGGHATIALRCPVHPVAQALLAAASRAGMAGLAAPSANRFGRVSPTTAHHVEEAFGPELLVLDGGPCTVGIESAIVDCTRGVPVLLRPGQLNRLDLERAAGRRLLMAGELDTPDPSASGTLKAHYAPRARVRLMTAEQIRAALQVLDGNAPALAVWARAPLQARGRQVLLRQMPDDAPAVARELFSVLRGFDQRGVRLIWVEEPPSGPAWDGVRDRLRRAAAA